jgi:hypothetical protein
MRKRIVGLHGAQQAGKLDQGWLDLEQIATIEVTSEDPSFPIESAFDRKMGQAGARPKKVNSRSGSSLTSRYRCGAFTSVSMRLTMSECRSLLFDGRFPRAANPAKSCDNNGISALPAQLRKLKIIWSSWRTSQS